MTNNLFIQTAEFLFLVTAIFTLAAFGLLAVSLTEQVWAKRRRFRNFCRNVNERWRDQTTNIRG